MKKLVVLLMFSVLLAGFVLADGDRGNGNQDDDSLPPMPSLISSQDSNGEGHMEEGNYTLENGEKIEVRLQSNNRFRVEDNDSHAECEEDCNLTQEKDQNRTRLNMHLSNGRDAEIKIMPSTASENALTRLRLKVCNETNNCTIQLKEVGNGNETRAAYEMQIERHYKLFGMFKTKAEARAQVDAENGEVIAVKNPWWAFLATKSD